MVDTTHTDTKFVASKFLVYWRSTTDARSILQSLNFETVDMSEPHSEKLVHLVHPFWV